MQAAIGDLFGMTAPQLNTVPVVVTKHETGGVAVVADAFDYGAWPKDIADAAREAAKRILASQEQHIALAVKSGRELVTIKAKLAHGDWLPWLERACRIDQRTAQRYMATAEAFGEEYDTVSYLPLGTVYKLAAPKAAPVRAEVASQIAAGDKPSVKDIENQFLRAQQDKRRHAKVETPQQRKMRLGKERRQDDKWLAQQDAHDAHAAEMDNRAAALADMLMSRLTVAEVERFSSEYLSGMRLERALEEWINPHLREGRNRERALDAAERRAKHERKWVKAA